MLQEDGLLRTIFSLDYYTQRNLASHLQCVAFALFWELLVLPCTDVERMVKSDAEYKGSSGAEAEEEA